jgi:hypothetical protein
MPDESYPIRDVASLTDAIQAFGRAKDPVAVKRDIVARARGLGRRRPVAGILGRQAIRRAARERHRPTAGHPLRRRAEGLRRDRAQLPRRAQVRAGGRAGVHSGRGYAARTWFESYRRLA